MKPWMKTASIFAAGFLLGIVATGLAIHFSFEMHNHDMHNPDAILNRLASRLNLTADQKIQVAALLQEELPKRDATFQESQAKAKAQRDRFTAKLKLILNPEQQKKLEKLQAKWNKGPNDHWSIPGFGPCITPGPLASPVPGK